MTVPARDTIPSLQTSRLTLRPMGLDDWDAYHREMASDRARYMGGPFSTAVAWGMFCSDHAQWSFFGCGALMIDDRSTGRCVGQVGISSGPLFPGWELGLQASQVDRANVNQHAKPFREFRGPSITHFRCRRLQRLWGYPVSGQGDLGSRTGDPGPDQRLTSGTSDSPFHREFHLTSGRESSFSRSINYRVKAGLGY